MKKITKELGWGDIATNVTKEARIGEAVGHLHNFDSFIVIGFNELGDGEMKSSTVFHNTTPKVFELVMLHELDRCLELMECILKEKDM